MPDVLGIPTMAFAVIAIVVTIVLVIMIAVRNYIKVAPDQVAIFYGRGKPKTVRGGGRLRIPGLETVKVRSLQPFKVDINVESIYSKDNVPVNVTGFGQVAFGITEEELETSMSKYLQSEDNEVHSRVKELLQGNMRDIVSGMTIEQLNNDRPELKRRVLEIATSTFQPLGMHVPSLTILGVSDNNGYLDALGQRRTAEVKRDAAVGKADAERETRISAAAANQAAAEAEAVSATAVAVAEQVRDVRIAELKAETDAASARADQAGPLAAAQARAAVGVADAEADQKREQAQISVEEQRALRATQAQRADVIVPAEATRQASVLRAEGERQAAILAAEAEAETRRLSGQADSDARKLAAAATQAEMEAQAAGEGAKLKAQAEGQRELAEAQNAFSESAQRLQVLPQLIATLPEIVKAIADGVQIEHMVVMDGGNGDGNGSALNRASSVVPVALFQANETLKALGIDLGSLLPSMNFDDKGGSDSGDAAVAEGALPATAATGTTE